MITNNLPTPVGTYSNLPEAMLQAKRWLLRKADKQPFYASGKARRGTLDSESDITQLATFDAALSALSKRNDFVGLGFALGPDGLGNCWQGIDFDHVSRWPELQTLVDKLPGYVEKSPSGDGYHSIGYGHSFSTIGSSRETDGIEAYAAGRYFTVTGDTVKGDIEDISKFVSETLAPIIRRTRGSRAANDSCNPHEASLDDELYSHIRSALSAIPSDDRDLWIRFGMALKPYAERGYCLWHEWSQKSGSYDPFKIELDWDGLKPRSEFDGGITYRSIFQEAAKRGWVNPAKGNIKWIELPTGSLANRLRELASKRPIMDPLEFEIETSKFFEDNGVRSSGTIARIIKALDRETRVYPIPQVPQDFRDLRMDPFERTQASLSPRVIVENYLFADLSLLSAAGGSGKTSLVLHEAIHIILGRDLWGCRVVSPGPVVLVTAEDPKEILIARLHRMMDSMELTLQEQEKVDQELLIWDVSNHFPRLVEMTSAGAYEITALAEDIINGLRGINPALVVFDPIVSFGPAISIVNDTEQALVVAGRRIFKALNCCVRFVTHVAQTAAREKITDQYASRGGTALPDGSRMVAVLIPWQGNRNEKIPAKLKDQRFRSHLKLTRPKCSYCPPQEPIYLGRADWLFDWAPLDPKTSHEGGDVLGNEDKVMEFLSQELTINERQYNLKALEAMSQSIGLSRGEVRDAVAGLISNRRIANSPLPKVTGKPGPPPTYLSPISNPDAKGAENEINK